MTSPRQFALRRLERMVTEQTDASKLAASIAKDAEAAANGIRIGIPGQSLIEAAQTEVVKELLGLHLGDLE